MKIATTDLPFKPDDEIRRRILEVLSEKRTGPLLVTFLNPQTWLACERMNVDLSVFHLMGIDSGILTRIVRALYIPDLTSSCFDLSGVAQAVTTKLSAGKPVNVALIGGQRGEAQQCGKYLTSLNKGGRLDIKICSSGYQDWGNPDVIACLARRIEMEKIQLVLVGCGGGLQEQVLSDLFEELKHSDNKNVLATLVMTSCGGFITQTAARGNFYPSWVVKLNVRWLYRFAVQPHVFVRTIRTYPVFFIRLIIAHFRNSSGPSRR